ncbi:MAG: lytic transglycosylase domain-containing protein [Gemmatimonadota bacterium]|nr:MAG: lytic transglycosylase domain-containing protein [Gemmatimonadota bacterium]
MGRSSRRGDGGSRWRGAVLLAVLAGAAAPAAHAGNIYSFVDENGVTHYSNVPNDDRYAPVVLRTPYPARQGAVPSYGGYDGLILLNARANKLPPALVKAVIAAESRFDSEAVSRAGAQGLMQLMPETARELGVEDPFRPEENVRGGTRYLREMLDRYGDMAHALAAYNAGPTAVDQYRGVPPYRETRDYVRRVLTYYRHYDGDFGY